MENWKQIKQTTKQTRTEKDQKIVADELTNQRQEARNAAYDAYEAAVEAALEAAEAAYEAAKHAYAAAAYRTYLDALNRINKEYPQ